MKSPFLSLVGTAILFANILHAEPSAPLTTSDIDKAVQSTKDLKIPLPSKTPFDSDLEARKVYLDSFQKGYRLAVARIISTCCAEKWKYKLAEETGQSDGQLQAIHDDPKRTIGTDYK